MCPPRTAGRAAAAAYAYRTGDAATLAGFGLNYDELRSLGDELEVLRRIVTMACAAPDSTIEDHEQRLVAAEIGEWVLEQERDGVPQHQRKSSGKRSPPSSPRRCS